MKKVKEEVANVAGDMATVDNKITDKPIRRKMKASKEEKPKKKIIKESDGFSFYQENDVNIFEINDPAAKNAYLQGYKSHRPQYWHNNEVTAEMLKQMNSEGGRNFSVKIDDNLTRPQNV